VVLAAQRLELPRGASQIWFARWLHRFISRWMAPALSLVMMTDLRADALDRVIARLWHLRFRGRRIPRSGSRCASTRREDAGIGVERPVHPVGLRSAAGIRPASAHSQRLQSCAAPSAWRSDGSRAAFVAYITERSVDCSWVRLPDCLVVLDQEYSVKNAVKLLTLDALPDKSTIRTVG